MREEIEGIEVRCTEIDEGRKRHLIAQALWEWCQEEERKPLKQERSSDLADVLVILQTEYVDEFALVMEADVAKSTVLGRKE